MNEGEEVKKGFFKGLGFVLALFAILIILIMIAGTFVIVENEGWKAVLPNWKTVLLVVFLLIICSTTNLNIVVLFTALSIFLCVTEKEWFRLALTVLLFISAYRRATESNNPDSQETKEKQGKEIDDAIEKELKNK